MLKSQPETITAWQQGDEQAVRIVFDAYYLQSVRLAILSGLPVDVAQDCAQEAFVHAFQRRRQLRDPAAFPLWFHRIVTRHILDVLRSKQHDKEHPLEVFGDLSEDWGRRRLPQPEEEAISTEERAHLWYAVQQLPPQYRVPLVLRYYGDFSLREVAALMGKREGTIRVIIHRALQRLRTFAEGQTWEVRGPVMHHIEVGQRGL